MPTNHSIVYLFKRDNKGGNMRAPKRPDGHPDSWVMMFVYTDKLTAGGGESTPIPFDSESAAQRAASNADSDHDGGGITVKAAFVYPPMGVEAEVYSVQLG